MYKRTTLVILLFWTVLAIQQRSVDAGPLKRLRRIVREVYPPDIEPESDGNQPQVCIVGDVVYGVEEPVPAEQPCLKCRCQPPGVQCETIRCTKKPGCKAIHRPNSCCPDYQCECEHNGRIYGNGEKLESDLGNECKVCYCRGGEIQCADVSCYIRKDCEGKHVPGTCCPKYDHCPPIDAVLESSHTTEGSITNNNPQSLEVLPLPSITQNNNETFLGQTTNEIQNDIEDIKVVKKTSDIAHSELEDLEKPSDAIGAPKITIQEIIPEIKEIPITASPKLEEGTPTQGQLLIEEAKQDITSINDLVTDAEPDSSEISEVFQQPPPVLRIGDKLLFLKKGELVPEKDTSTPTSVITIIGAEGLQRGFEESGEAHEEVASNFTETNDLELKTSESSHILSLVKKRNKVESTTEALVTSTTTSLPLNDTITTVTDLPESLTTAEASLQQTKVITEVVTELMTEAKPNVEIELKPEVVTETKTESVNSEVITETKPDSSTETIKVLDVPEQNPEYPPIPDVMISSDDTSQRFDNEDKQNSTEKSVTQQIEEDIIEMKILPEIITIRNNVTIPENVTHPEWLKNETATEGYTTEVPTTVKTKEDLVTETNKSVESIEEATEESGEQTTEKNNKESVKSPENISLESDSSELKDMLKVESTTTKLVNDVEFIGEIQKIDDVERPINKDVEIIKVETSTRPEELPKPEKIMVSSPRSIGKRENTADDEADEVFKQLDFELNAENTQRIQTAEEEQREADQVFKELLEETSTPKAPTPPQGRNKDADTLQRVSDALAKLTFKGQLPDSNILGVLSNFFGSQYKSYRK